MKRIFHHFRRAIIEANKKKLFLESESPTLRVSSCGFCKFLRTSFYRAPPGDCIYALDIKKALAAEYREVLTKRQQQSPGGVL